MMNDPVFGEFQKIPRWKREMVITEKIDGTNAQVFITDDAAFTASSKLVAQVGSLLIFAGSRTRWVIPGDDNFGWAGWVQRNAEELSKLGAGSHFGEWWGAGIQRKYGLSEKRFSLFNVHVWGAHNPDTPACCGVVPILARGEDPGIVDAALDDLAMGGSKAAPGFMEPEGVVVYHTALRGYFKKTLEKDGQPKGLAR